MMGADTPAEGGGNKPTVKVENKSPAARRVNNKHARRDDYVKKEKFLGGAPNLQGFVFEAKWMRAEQVANFEKMDKRFRNI